MKGSLLATTFVAFPLSAKTTRLRNYGCVAVVLLAGCTATQTRWDATNIRKEVMVYYNDQIMDNLIRAKNHLPFVHVDINLLTSQGSSQISGTIGAGEMISNTDMHQRTNQTVTTDTTGAMPSHMLAGTIATMGTLAHAAMRPFTYSVTPQQTETLSIQAAPALGTQAIVSTPMNMEVTKETENFDAAGKKTSSTKEHNPTPKKPVTIYQLYENFAQSSHLFVSPIRPQEGTYVQGTLKRSGAEYYYIANNDTDKLAYYEFCKKLFTKGQAGSLERALQQTQAAAALPTR